MLLEWEPVIAACQYMGWNLEEYQEAPADMIDTIRARMKAGYGMPQLRTG